MIAVCVCEGRSPRCVIVVSPGSKRLFPPVFCHPDFRRRSSAADLSSHLQPPWLTGAAHLTLAFILVLVRPLIGLGHIHITALVCSLSVMAARQ